MPTFSLRSVFKISKLVTIPNTCKSSCNLTKVPEALFPDNVLVSVENGVRKIVINRPEPKNALRYDMAEKIGNALLESNSDSATKLITITGAGDFFSSGNDLSNWDTSDQTITDIIEKSRKFYLKSLFIGFIECRKAIVALVNGPAIGVGTTLLAHCDQVLASDKAYFRTPFTAIGILPEFCSSYLFPKVMGSSKANDMLLFGNKLTAKEAQACGLVTRVFPSETFAESCQKYIDMYAQLPLEPMMKAKELIRAPEREKLKHVAAYESDMGVTCIETPFFKSNIEKFFAKKGK